MCRRGLGAVGGHGSKQRDSQTAGFATIPPELANTVAAYAERLLEPSLSDVTPEGTQWEK